MARSVAENVSDMTVVASVMHSDFIDTGDYSIDEALTRQQLNVDRRRAELCPRSFGSID